MTIEILTPEAEILPINYRVIKICALGTIMDLSNRPERLAQLPEHQGILRAKTGTGGQVDGLE